MKFEIGDIVKRTKTKYCEPCEPTIGVISGVIASSDPPLSYVFIPLIDEDKGMYCEEYCLELIKRGNTAMYREKLLMGEEF